MRALIEAFEGFLERVEVEGFDSAMSFEALSYEISIYRLLSG
jgi:hypothetical protein